MRRVLLIGIGAGDPEHLTVQAIKALNAVDVFFIVDKGDDKQDLVRLRQEICDRYVEHGSYRMVEVRDPERDRSASAYRAAVEDWRRRRADIYERLIRNELGEEGRGAFLVWGDPSLYDSTLAIVDEILARGNVAFELEVVPGISSIQALAAKHRVTLTRVGRPVQITTGRLLSAGFPAEADDVVVMLDADCSFRQLADDEGEFDIYWGAYVGTEDELLVAGELSAVTDEIERIRSEARARKGWIMDSYLLRRRSP